MRSVRLLSMNEIASIPFFNDLSDDSLKLLSEMLEVYYYEQNKYIFKEGEKQDSMFFILTGSVIVAKNTEDGKYKQLAQLDAPQVIGEMALISPASRSASIISISPVTIVRFSCASFEKIIKIKPALAVNMLRKAGETVSNRLRKTNIAYIKAVNDKQ